MTFRTLLGTLIFLISHNFIYADIYVILYATYQGKTGHIGLAVDEYKIIVKDINKQMSLYKIDTIKTGYLKYYDLWPKNERFKLALSNNQEPKYYKLPSYQINNLISLKTLVEEGIPHKEQYPADGILSKKTKCMDDFIFTSHIERLINENKPFNAVYYNCTDFVIECLQRVINNLYVETEIIFTYAVNTPNNLFRSLWKIANFDLIKNPSNKINGSFFNDRIIYHTLKLKLNENTKTN